MHVVTHLWIHLGFKCDSSLGKLLLLLGQHDWVCLLFFLLLLSRLLCGGVWLHLWVHRITCKARLLLVCTFEALVSCIAASMLSWGACVSVSGP